MYKLMLVLILMPILAVGSETKQPKKSVSGAVMLPGTEQVVKKPVSDIGSIKTGAVVVPAPSVGVGEVEREPSLKQLAVEHAKLQEQIRQLEQKLDKILQQLETKD